jgi:hypothetical protein
MYAYMYNTVYSTVLDFVYRGEIVETSIHWSKLYFMHLLQVPYGQRQVLSIAFYRALWNVENAYEILRQIH